MISKTDLCRNTYGNLGREDCLIPLEKIEGIFIMPKSLAFSAANVASDPAFIAAMNVATLATSPAARLYPLLKAGSFKNVSDGTADPTEEKAEYMQILGVTYDKHTISIELGNVGLHLRQQLFKYKNNSGIAFGFYMKNGAVAFQKTSSGGAKGFGGQLIPSQIKQAGASTISSMMVKIVLDDYDAFENPVKMLMYPFNEQYVLPDLIHGLHDVELKTITATSSVITVSCIRSGDFATMATEYPTIRAANAFILKNTATGVAVTPTGVNANELGQILISGSIPAAWSLQLNTPTILSETPLFIGDSATGGYESNLLTGVTA